LTSNEKLTNFSIRAPVTGFNTNGTITSNVQNYITLPNSLTGPSYYAPWNTEHSENSYKEGIYLQTTRNNISAIGTFHRSATYFDTFFAIPTVDLYLDEYTYYAISVGSLIQMDGSVVIVGTANQTTLNINVPVSAVIKIDNSGNWSQLAPGTLYSYIIQRLQIVYIAAFTTDLTGTKVTTNKPISLFSGHECAQLPDSTCNCNHIVEQIPPTKLWGTVNYFAPLADRILYIIKIVAAYDYTNVNIYCNSNSSTINTVNNFTINAGRFAVLNYTNQEYCGVYANQVVLVAQFSHSVQTDLKGDPMMTLVPSTTHYTNSITSSTFQLAQNNFNIIVMASYFQPDMMTFSTNGVITSLNSHSWVPIIINNNIHAFALQVTQLLNGMFTLTHANDLALMTMVAYGFGNYKPYGHPGWLKSQINGMLIVI